MSNKKVDWSSHGTSNGAATPLSSPTKLAPHHNIFMANLQKSPTRTTSDIFVDMDGTNVIPSSTKVIESLHEQIDILSRTNLQLSMQSQGLLTKLENNRDKESKLVDTLSQLKNENETLKNLLNRETDHLKDLEIDLNDLNEKYNTLNKENRSLKKEYNKNNNGDSSINDELFMVESQYSSLVEANKMMESHYDNDITDLKRQLDELNSLKFQMIDTLDENEDTLIEQMTDLNVQSTEFEEMYKESNDTLDEQFHDALNENTETMSNEYVYYKDQMIDLGTQMGTTTVEKDITDLQIIKLRKVRNVSGTNSNSTSNNSSKRTSFYSSMTPVTMPESKMEGHRNISPIIGLPGVKRSASTRRNQSPVI